jgi:FkbM family methyltransferase
MTTKHSLFAPKTLSKLFYIWTIYLIKNMVRRKRFVAVTPPFLKVQRLFDRETRKVFEIRVRDGVDWTQMEHIYLCRDYDLSSTSRYGEILHYYDTLVKDGKSALIVDCGANIGLASKYFLQSFPCSKVVAIEPDGGNIAMAKINNTQGEIDYYQAAISSEMGKGTLIDMGAANTFRVRKESAGNLECITVNHLLELNAAFTPFIIKIDIEGSEADLFADNLEWIDRFPVIFVELHDWMLPKRRNSESFLKAMAVHDRDFIHFQGYVLSISNQI